jgi:hypothetical protein
VRPLDLLISDNYCARHILDFDRQTLLGQFAPSDVAKSYFSPRKITLRNVSSTPPATPMAKIAARPAQQFKFFRRISNAGVRVGGQQNAVNRQAAGSHKRTGDVTGIIIDA